MTTGTKICENSSQEIIVQDCPQETGCVRKQSREDKEYVSREKNRMPPAPRHHKWMTGKSAVTLHR